MIEAEFKKKHNNNTNSNNNDESTTNSNLSKKTSHTATKKLNTSSLNHGITEEEKARVQELFDEMDKNNLWILEETKRAAANEVGEALSVEEKILKFALSCNFRHPSQLFILDLTDKHWENVFTQKELQELEETGDKVLVPVDNAIEEKLNELNEFDTAEDVYSYSRTIDHNPKEQPWLAWFTMTLMKTAYPFIHNVNISTYLESDKQYLLWGFLNDIFTGSNIAAQGKEKTSKASATQSNNKRKLSAIDEVKRKAMGRRMDCIYIGGSKELGCMEVGSVADQTKEFKDSGMKMPIVMKDMLREIVEKAPTLVRRVHMIGYMITGEQVSMLDMDSPKGYVSRVRHTVAIDYPSCSEDYVARIGPLIELASIVKTKIETTLKIYQTTRIPLEVAKHGSFTLPPNPFSSSTSSTPTTTTTATPESSSEDGSLSSHSSKRSKNHQ
ncbi:hypothetical protein INT45_004399 [Circinella minor]|uniref:Uncharacterized protein n=1 Tax=Circinella minor TaxID=1195481 RepID=A0A8H7S892_9FUNG|nr:hypothetical protein INT45_004399 [Circinella minor]